MNYYRGRSLSFLGLRANEIFIECAQSRRLPFVQIIGASVAAANEQRERVLAAIEASGFRLPGRRLTVRYSPDVHGLPLETFDCAVALAILGTLKAFPAEQSGPFYALGCLGLNGALHGAGDPQLLRAWRNDHPSAVLYLPWEESIILGAEGAGGGFQDLRSLVDHLRTGSQLAPRKRECAPDPTLIPMARAAFGLSAAEQRLCEISAAGGHHLLVMDGQEEQGFRLAAAVRSLLPGKSAGLSSSSSSGQSSAEGPPLRVVNEAQAGRLFRFDRKHGSWGELSLAHGGVLHLRDFRHQSPALAPLWEAMREGSLRYTVGPRPAESPADLITVAETAPCECGGSARLRAACVCRPLLKERRLRQFASAPFDLRCFAAPAVAAERGLDPLAVYRARARMLKERGRLNGRLSLSEALRAKGWANDAKEWLRIGDRKLGVAEALARTALTVSDLKDAGEVSRDDVLEAWHHVAGLEFLGRSGARRSPPALNSTAIP